MTTPSVLYDSNDSLPENSVIKVYKDSKQRIWFISYTGYLSYFENGHITPYQSNATFRKYLRSSIIASLQVDKKDIIRLEVNSAYTRIYITGNKEYVSSYNLRIFEQNLDSNLLIRVPRSHIINILKVEKLAEEKQMHLLMNDDSLIKIARCMKQDFIMQAQNKGLAL